MLTGPGAFLPGGEARMEEQKDKKFIDIDKMLKTKAPGPYRFISAASLNSLGMILHPALGNHH